MREKCLSFIHACRSNIQRSELKYIRGHIPVNCIRHEYILSEIPFHRTWDFNSVDSPNEPATSTDKTLDCHQKLFSNVTGYYKIT